MPHQLDRWMYRGGRPNRVARYLNRLWAKAAEAGLPPRRLYALEVRGRRSGRVRSFPVVVADHEGERYLVAMLGDGANWVANVRAAGGQAVLRHGRREAVRLEEVDPGARAPILKRYLELAPGARAHIAVDPGATLAEFERIAARYPVFRVSTIVKDRGPDDRPAAGPPASDRRR
jgi:deazaflavin-dependent oxidoreductase (nitroreductase family)